FSVTGVYTVYPASRTKEAVRTSFSNFSDSPGYSMTEEVTGLYGNFDDGKDRVGIKHACI
ncbi:MAG: hypothetical protein LBF78_02015, partial [Treponema sp.]|nr:hypothetical protein [Treponema sp.]